MNLNEYAKAMADYEKAIALNPAYADALQGLARARRFLK